MAYKKRISGSIDSYGWFRWTIQETLSKHKDEEVHLIIMSQGGAVNEAIAISDLLAEHGNVTVEFSGLAASSATWLAFGAKRILMHEDTLWLCHKCSSLVSEWAQMNADELDAYIDRLKSQKKSLEVIDAIIAKKYLDRASSKNKTLQQVIDLMKEERYLPASDCLEWGFVDEILPTKSPVDEGNVISNEFLGAVHLPLLKGNELDKTSETSILDKAVQRLTALFGKTENQEKNKLNKIEMKKDLVSINALLQIEGVDVSEDGKVTLTVDQLTRVENALAASQKEINDATTALDAVSPKVKAITGLCNKVAAVNIMLEKSPVVPAQVHKQEDQKKNGEEVDIDNGDAITNEARENYRAPEK